MPSFFLSYETFAKKWKQHFPYVLFSRAKKLPKCDTCVHYGSILGNRKDFGHDERGKKRGLNLAQWKAFQSEFKKHQDLQVRERLQYKLLTEQAGFCPAEKHSCIGDFTDKLLFSNLVPAPKGKIINKCFISSPTFSFVDVKLNSFFSNTKIGLFRVKRLP